VKNEEKKNSKTLGKRRSNKSKFPEKKKKFANRGSGTVLLLWRGKGFFCLVAPVLPTARSDKIPRAKKVESNLAQELGGALNEGIEKRKTERGKWTDARVAAPPKNQNWNLGKGCSGENLNRLRSNKKAIKNGKKGKGKPSNPKRLGRKAEMEAMTNTVSKELVINTKM